MKTRIFEDTPTRDTTIYGRNVTYITREPTMFDRRRIVGKIVIDLTEIPRMLDMMDDIRRKLDLLKTGE